MREMLDRIVYGDVTIMDMLTFLIIFIVAIIVARNLVAYLRVNFKERLSTDHFQIITKSIYYVIIGTATVLGIPLLGVKLSGLLVAGGVAGVVLGFASQSVVSNLISGLFIMIERPIKIGQTIKIGDVSGTVEEIRIMSTIITTFEGLLVRIPNVNVFTSTLTNNMANVARRVSYVIGIRYKDNVALAREIILAELEREPLILIEPKPLVFLNDLDNNASNLYIRFWAPTVEWWEMVTRMLERLKAALEAQGIQVALPQRMIWQGDDPDAQVIPGDAGDEKEDRLSRRS